MKWLLIAVVFIVCVIIGFLFSLKYKKRSNFFKALILLSQKLDIGINFSRERLQNLFGSLDEGIKKDLNNLTDNYISYLQKNGELNSDKLFQGINFLKDYEREIILMFFKMLGRSDVESQSKEIKNFELRFNELACKASEENKKYGGLSLKMGLIIGLMAAVVLW